MYSLIVTAKMNDIAPQAWLADVLARIADHRHIGSKSCYRGTGRSQCPQTLQPKPPDNGGN